MTINLVLAVLALVCFALVWFEVPVPRQNLVGAGLFFWLLSTLI